MSDNVRAGDPNLLPIRSPGLSKVESEHQRYDTRPLRQNHLSISEDNVGVKREILLGQIGIEELLDTDPRPTFIIDLDDAVHLLPGPLELLFANDILRSNPGLFERVTGLAIGGRDKSPTLELFPAFKTWILDREERQKAFVSSYEYSSHRWTRRTLGKQGRLKIITGVSGSESAGLGRLFADEAQLSSHQDSLATSSNKGINSAPALPPPYLHPYSGIFRPIGSELAFQSPTGSSPSSGSSPTIFSPQSINLNSQGYLPLRVPSDELVESSVHTNKARNGFFDWTRLSDKTSLLPHIRFALGVDWASTALGPMEKWPWDLRLMCNLIMNCPFPAAFYWGDDLTAIYNEAYVPLAGKKHPTLMGRSYREAWAEIWPNMEPAFLAAEKSGTASYKENDKLFINRYCFYEEAYFSWSIIPIIGADGSISGYYNPTFEMTRQIVAERRMHALKDMEDKTAAAKDVKSFWSQVLSTLAREDNSFDFPFVLLYSITEQPGENTYSTHTNSIASGKHCVLEGILGVPEGHPAAPRSIELESGAEGFGKIFREAVREKKPILILEHDPRISPEIFDGIQPRGYPEPCCSSVVCPIYPSSGKSPLGFIVAGINQRLEFNEDYSLFIQLLQRQCSAAIDSALLFETEITGSEKVVEPSTEDGFSAPAQFASQAQETAENESKFTRIWEHAPVGMFIADSEGRMTYANETWYDISNQPRGRINELDWTDLVQDEDRPLVQKLRTDLIGNMIPSSVQFRFKGSWQDKEGRSSDTWVLCAAYPEIDQNGVLKSVFGCVTNISDQKRAEGLQRQRMEEAVELKRQQENFIDITSHEMRNPLSAILQCADEISTSLSELKDGHNWVDRAHALEHLTGCIEAAQTIHLCAQHQKRIINDILTLSKLDSALLLVTPVDVQPKTVVEKALKMFESEAHSTDVQLLFSIENSFSELQVDWVRLDPSRLLQVMINLITNAIKFTSSQSNDRKVNISIGASRERPKQSNGDRVSYFPPSRKQVDFISGDDWGKGEILYLHFAVEDTGSGLSESEKKLLFQRFSQASPRTHVTYGGSGLGLYISKNLVELQGGEIGVSSVAGEGSTFAFWIQCRRTTPPTNPPDSSLTPPLGRKTSATKLPSNLPAAMFPPPFETSPPTPLKPESMINILVVEDNVVNSRVLMKQLQKQGFAVTLANHGGEAIDALQESRRWRGNPSDARDIHVMLMDLEMPVMDGLTCTRKIRELEKSGKLAKNVPIIAVSANARAEQVAHAREAGVDDVVSKPFQIVKDLLPKVHALVERSG